MSAIFSLKFESSNHYNDPEGNSFVFPRVLTFPETKSRETSGYNFAVVPLSVVGLFVCFAAIVEGKVKIYNKALNV